VTAPPVGPRRDIAPLAAAASKYAHSPHPVEMPIEALGHPAEKNGGQDPPASAADENGQRRRQVGQRSHEDRPDHSAGERDGGSD